MSGNNGSKVSRRTFLAAVGVGGVATVAAVAYKAVPNPTPQQDLSNKRRSKRYQVTEHIQNYYRTAQV